MVSYIFRKRTIKITIFIIVLITLFVQYQYVLYKQKHKVEALLLEKIQSASEAVLLELPRIQIETEQGNFQVPDVDNHIKVESLFHEKMLLVIQDSRMPLFKLESTDISFQAGFDEGKASAKIKFEVEA